MKDDEDEKKKKDDDKKNKVKYTLIGLVIGLAVDIGLYVWRKLSKAPESNEDILQQSKDKMDSFNETLRKNAECRENDPVIDIEKEPYLWLDDQLIHRYENVALVAKPKVGKTFSGLNIAESPHIDKVFYLSLDDVNGTQQIRLDQSAASKKMTVVTSQRFLQEKKKLQDIVEEKCDQKVVWDHILPDSAKLRNKRDKLLRELGVRETNRIDNILLFEILMSRPEMQEYDMIIVDSLNRLLESPGRINQRYLDRIIRAVSGKGKTFIVLHHINKQGEITGGSAFSEIFDSVITLEKVDGNRILVDATTSRFKQKVEKVIIEMVPTGDNSVTFNVLETLSATDHSGVQSNLKERILAFLKATEIISFDELANKLQEKGSLNKNSIKNSLKELEDDGLVRKADGKTWDNIVVVSPSS
jgi:archaellum biogenesis ATPase FlaH